MSFRNWLFPEYNDRLCLSLAGVLQSAYLVDSLSQTGICDEDAYQRCLLALLNTDPKDDADLFGSQGDMSIGLRELTDLCQLKDPQKVVTKYAVQILHLQKLLTKKPSTQQKVYEGLKHAQKQLALYGSDNENLILNLAELYQSSISPLGFRIQITGKHQYLQQDMIAAKVRVLLFSGIRFAFLWRQSGGHSHHLVTSKRSIKDQSARLRINPYLNREH